MFAALFLGLRRYIPCVLRELDLFNNRTQLIDRWRYLCLLVIENAAGCALYFS